MKGKAKIIVSIFSFLLAIIALATSSFAWITSIKRSSNIVFVTGEVKYVLTGKFDDFTNIIPNTELIRSKNQFQLTNHSTIDSELRMKISYTITNPNSQNEEWILFTNTAIGTKENNTNTTDKLMGTISSDSQFTWDYLDGSWYLKNNGSPIMTDKDTGNIPVLESLFFNGNAFGNDDLKVKNTFTIKIEFQAKQNKFVTWEELGRVTVTK